MQDKTAEQAQMLFNRLKKRFRHLKKWAHRTGAGVFRLYDRDIPEIPLVLDFYGDAAQEAAVCGALYKRPYEKDESDETKWLCAMKDSIACALGINSGHIFFKQRQKQKGASQYEKIQNQVSLGKGFREAVLKDSFSFESKAAFSKAEVLEKPSSFEKIIHENKLAFKVNLSDYLDTGLFADRRLLRAAVRNESSGKKVLNLFSYTGSFSVYAAAGGAVSTDSVDLSNTYLNWARENFLLNGFSAEREDERRMARVKNEKRGLCAHRLIRSDVLEFISGAVKENREWDIIVVDPPAFSNSKKMTDDFDLNRDLIKLLAQCLKLLASGGKIFVSINVKRGAPAAEKLEMELKNTRVMDLSGDIEDEDFKSRKIPRGFVIERA